MEAISTRSTKRGCVTAIYCTKVLADTTVSSVRDQRDAERRGDSDQLGKGIDSHLPHHPTRDSSMNEIVGDQGDTFVSPHPALVAGDVDRRLDAQSG